ncbi:MAG: rRNA maturation RNase YbeY [Ginsengibacter sp.]
MSGIIQFRYNNVNYRLKNIKQVKECLVSIFASEGYVLDKLLFIFCNDSYLLDLNIKYLEHDTFTDILTFGLSENGEPIEAEIYISVERVMENAVSYQSTISQELKRVLIHGILHLCGYKDHEKSDVLKMREKEEYYLSRFL